MSFGWSAGDIATAITLVVQICKALDETFGASTEYRDITHFLDGLKYTLEKLLQISENQQLENAAQLREQVNVMRPKVENFLNLIDKKYGQNLGKDSSRRFRAIAGKLEWAAVTSTKARELRDSIGSNMQTIDRLIQFEIYASVQEKIPGQLRLGLSGVEEHITNTIQPLHEDVSQTLEQIKTQQSLIADTLRSVEATIQSQSRGNSPQPPAYSSVSPPPLTAPLVSGIPSVVTKVVNQYRTVPSKKLITGFEHSGSQPEVVLISHSDLESLDQWFKHGSSELSWIKGASSTNKSLSLAGGLFTAGRYSKTQVIGFSISKSEPWVAEGQTPREVIARIISSLAHQLVSKLAVLAHSRTGQEPESPLVTARFSVLGHKNQSALAASIDIIDNLVELTTAPFVVVLDCFEKYNLVKDKVTTDKMIQLIDIFRRKTRIKLILLASSQKYLAGVGVGQSHESSKHDLNKITVNPTMVDMLDNI